VGDAAEDEVAAAQAEAVELEDVAVVAIDAGFGMNEAQEGIVFVVAFVEGGAEDAADGAAAVEQEGLVEFLLAFKETVEGTGGKLRAFSDFLHGGGVETALGEDGESGLEDFLAVVEFLALAAREPGFGHGRDPVRGSRTPPFYESIFGSQIEI
jgi:hypothetical protein